MGARLQEAGHLDQEARLSGKRWQLNSDFILFSLKGKLLVRCESEAEIYNESHTGLNCFIVKGSISLLTHMEPNCRTSKPPHKGDSVGVNFTDCEKPKIWRFLLFGADVLFLLNFPVSLPCHQMLS